MVVLYIYIYNPPFAGLPLMPIELLLLFSLGYLTVFNKWFKILSIFQIEVVIFFLIVSFCFIRELFGFGNVFFRVNIFFFLQTVVLPYFIVNLYSKITTHKNLLKDIINIGFVAALFTLMMLFVPVLDEVIRYRILKTDDFTELVAYRAFGLSEGLTFAYGTTQGLVFGLALFYAKKYPIYYCYLPIILLSIIFNARIGLVPVVFSLMYFVFIKFNIKLISIISSFSLVFYVVIFKTSIFSEYTKTIEWAFDFFIQSSDFITGNSSSSTNTFDILFGDMAVLPNGIQEWLFGTGENIFLASSGNSDIGYLIQLNYGGITYVVLLFTLIGYMMYRLRFLYRIDRWLIFLFLTTIVITNIKGLMISIIPSFRLIAIIYCYLIMENKLFKKNKLEDFSLLRLSNPKSISSNA